MIVKTLQHNSLGQGERDEATVLALGFFDGVHRGHQAVLKRAIAEARERGVRASVMTFNQHPSVVFKKAAQFQQLTDMAQKLAHFEQLGFDCVYVATFTSKFAAQTPQQFVDNCIVHLGAVAVVAGFDYTYGPVDTANMAQLPHYAQERFDIICVSSQETDSQKIASTRIREAITAGELAKANQLLGYAFQTVGTVVHGDARGRTIGFPTANIRPRVDSLLPAVGVYVVSICVDNHWYQGMASVGYNITFEQGRDLSVEVHIFEFSDMIYGEQVCVAWHHRLRPELAFNSVAELTAQLQRDEADSRAFFAKEPIVLEIEA